MSAPTLGAIQMIALITAWLAWAMLAAHFYHRFIANGDVIKDANMILDEAESIETFVDDFLPAVNR